jgi:hypothetical protein
MLFRNAQPHHQHQSWRQLVVGLLIGVLVAGALVRLGGLKGGKVRQLSRPLLRGLGVRFS